VRCQPVHGDRRTEGGNGQGLLTFRFLRVLEISRFAAIAPAAASRRFDSSPYILFHQSPKFRVRVLGNPINNIIFVLFGKYYPIVVQLSSKDLSFPTKLYN
jgi:hypothetical protein